MTYFYLFLLSAFLFYFLRNNRDTRVAVRPTEEIGCVVRNTQKNAWGGGYFGNLDFWAKVTEITNGRHRCRSNPRPDTPVFFEYGDVSTFDGSAQINPLPRRGKIFGSGRIRADGLFGSSDSWALEKESTDENCECNWSRLYLGSNSNVTLRGTNTLSCRSCWYKRKLFHWGYQNTRQA